MFGIKQHAQTQWNQQPGKMKPRFDLGPGIVGQLQIGTMAEWLVYSAQGMPSAQCAWLTQLRGYSLHYVASQLHFNQSKWVARTLTLMLW